jgi:ferredoxin
MAKLLVGPGHVRVDETRCMSGGYCAEILPALFHQDSNHIAHVYGPATEVDVADVEEAIACCPAQAIAWIARPSCD